MDSDPVWWTAPEAGDIVWCYFPVVPGNPGPKPRPALVLNVDDTNPNEPWVEVIYGTSKKVRDLHAGQFAIAKFQNPTAYKLAGISYDTKFDCKQSVRLPFNNQWFDLAPGLSKQSPVMGSLHASMLNALKSAWQAVNADG